MKSVNKFSRLKSAFIFVSLISAVSYIGPVSAGMAEAERRQMVCQYNPVACQIRAQGLQDRDNLKCKTLRDVLRDHPARDRILRSKGC